MSAPATDAARCPVCGSDNRCAMEAARRGGAEASACWCQSVEFAPGALDEPGAVSRRGACLCRRCATRQVASGSAWPGADAD
ncbi:MAG: cysteine-rich CWC family protein [Gammaproteobacteria bacterium]|nr:cysteine-rich CWC family protein [Gammaproteobacteria bacterium]MBU1443199.1 cysteine-rich CWC family protein [Gammaproteobacteria bacterium]MBU2409196.1 cysteine-rich CWC family protein [Gammaproteobacteria bacterium]